MDEQDDAINRRKLGDLIEERLLSQLQGQIPGQIPGKSLLPGDTLPSERELMEQYKVGRPAIREAMQSLQRKGLIQIRHGERPRVAQPSFDRTLSDLAETIRHVLAFSQGSLGHLKEARLMFETEMARRAAKTHAEADLKVIESLLERQAASPPGSHDFIRLDGEFHAAIAQISGNPILTSLARALFGWLSEFHVDQVRKPGLETLTIAEHRAIFAGIRDRDADRAAREMTNHLERANALYRSSHSAQTP